MNYQTIDLDTYPRRDHFEHFLAMTNPFSSCTVKVDITDWYRTLKEKKLPFFLSFQYAVIRAANRVPQLRQRIVEDGIREYVHCDPSYTVALPDGTYRYCLVHTDQPFRDYLEEGARKQEEALKAEHLTEEGDVLSLLFITCAPWFSYESLDCPWPDKRFSIPNIGWGKFTKETLPCLKDGVLTEKETVKLPVSVFTNHALVDGLHIGQFFAYLEEELANFPW